MEVFFFMQIPLSGFIHKLNATMSNSTFIHYPDCRSRNSNNTYNRIYSVTKQISSFV